MEPTPETAEAADDPGPPWRAWLRNAAVGLLLVAAAGGAVAWLMTHRPGAGSGGDGGEAEAAAPLVTTTTAERGRHRATITARGTVRPARRVALAPRVGGRVIEVAPALEAGGRVAKGDVLARIDPADYRTALAEAKAELARARAEKQIARGEQRTARAELEQMEAELSDAERALVLREPRMQKAEADLADARAAVKQARRDLERTKLRAPFDAVVESTDVQAGSQVSAGQTVARLVGTGRFYVDLAVPVRALEYIPVDGPDGKGARVTLTKPGAWGPDARRIGRVARLRPDLTETGRMARVRVAVPAPLDRTPRLLLGTYLKGRIAGRSLGRVVALDRAWLRGDRSVWVMTPDDRLEIRAVHTVFRDAGRVYIDAGLSGGERVVTSPLATPAAGMRLRTRDGGEDGA